MMERTWWFAVTVATLFASATGGCGKSKDSGNGEPGAQGGSAGSAAPVMRLLGTKVDKGSARIQVETSEDIYTLHSKTESVRCSESVSKTIDGKQEFGCDLSFAPFGKVDVVVEYMSHAGTSTLSIPLDNAPYLSQQGGDFTCKGVECKGTLEVDYAELSAEDGTKLTYGGGTAVVTGGKPARAEPDLWPEVQKLTLAELRDVGHGRMINIPLSIQFPSGVVVTGSHQISRGNLLGWVATWLGRAKDGPVKFPGETATTGGNALLALYGSGQTELYGKAEQLTDIGRIAVRDQTKRGVACGKYVGTATGEETKFGLIFVDETYTIYDRRTGKKLASRRFAAEARRCPESYRTDGYAEAAVSSPDPDVVITWLKSQAG